MKSIIGIGLIIIGVLMGLYVGVWVGFIGGVVQIIEQIKAENIDAMSVAIGLARIFFSSLMGAVTFLVFLLVGRLLID